METFLQNFLGDLPESLAGGGIAIIIIFLVVGLLQNFFGYKLQKFWISAAGFIIGFLLGVIIVNGVTDVPQKAVIGVLVGIAAGVICAIIAFKLYKLGVFCFSAFSAYSIIYAIFPQDKKQMGIVIAVVAALLVGILAIKFIKPVLIISTSIKGGLYASTAAFALINYENNSLLVVLVGLALAIVGIIVQLGITRNR